jgi:hypothetical protein
MALSKDQLAWHRTTLCLREVHFSQGSALLLPCGRRQQDGRHACRLVVGAARLKRLQQHVHMVVGELVCSSLRLSCGQVGTHNRQDSYQSQLPKDLQQRGSGG